MKRNCSQHPEICISCLYRLHKTLTLFLALTPICKQFIFIMTCNETLRRYKNIMIDDEQINETFHKLNFTLKVLLTSRWIRTLKDVGTTSNCYREIEPYTCGICDIAMKKNEFTNEVPIKILNASISNFVFLQEDVSIKFCQ